MRPVILSPYSSLDYDSPLGSAPAAGQGLFGSAPKLAENTSTSASNPFGGGNFGGKKPEEQTGTSSAPKPFFNLGSDSGSAKDSAPVGEYTPFFSPSRCLC